MKKQIKTITFLATSILLTTASAVENSQETYLGSSFNEVLNVITDNIPTRFALDNPEEYSLYAQNDKLPHYKVSSRKFFERVSGKKVNLLARDSIRTVSEQFDYYDRIEKLLHPNGICLSGTWEITEPSEYTGYFSQGKKGLMIGRASTALTNTRAGRNRGFGFAGKLYPTMDPDEVHHTANFFLIDVLFGTRAKHYMDVSLTSQPKTGFDFFNLFTGLLAAKALFKADRDPQLRPLYPISELGTTEGDTIVTPKWMMIKAATETRVDEKDFRLELDAAKYPEGVNFDIYVSDKTNNSSKLDQWTRLGQISLNQSITSYGCDRRLHFAHPKIKDTDGKKKPENTLVKMMLEAEKEAQQ